MNDPAASVHQFVDHLFRHSAGRMVANLVRIFGPGHLELAEDVVQEALVKALRTWPFQGVPEEPVGWLVQVARNRALDAIRRDVWLRHKEAEIQRWAEQAHPPVVVAEPDELLDDQLRLMFLCCHPAIPRDAGVSLTLKTLAGFGISEIARAFLCSEETIAQRIVRAKRRIREQQLPLVLPGNADLAERLDAVLEVLYLLFNEGYTACQGDDLVRTDLVQEALRLTALLLQHPITNQPRAHALLALMYFQGARLAARVDAAGNLLLLERQDRSLWDRAMIQSGFVHLHEAGRGAEITEYHIQAGIASCHALAPTFAATDWGQILSYYDLLVQVNPSPIIRLNRAVAVARVHGVEEGMRQLNALESEKSLRSYYLLPATHGEFLRQLGRPADAVKCFRDALALECSGPEKRFLLKKLAELQP